MEDTSVQPTKKFISITTHEHRELTCISTVLVGGGEVVKISLMKRRPQDDEDNNAHNVRGSTVFEPEMIISLGDFTNFTQLNWTKLIFNQLGKDEVPNEMVYTPQIDEDTGLRNDSKYTTVIHHRNDKTSAFRVTTNLYQSDSHYKKAAYFYLKTFRYDRQWGRFIKNGSITLHHNEVMSLVIDFNKYIEGGAVVDDPEQPLVISTDDDEPLAKIQKK